MKVRSNGFTQESQVSNSLIQESTSSRPGIRGPPVGLEDFYPRDRDLIPLQRREGSHSGPSGRSRFISSRYAVKK